MHRATSAARAAAAAFALFLAAAPAAAQQPKWGPHVDLEAKPGTERNLGEADLFVPLWQDRRSLLFGNLRARPDNESGYEGNIGAGLRRMLESGWNVGGYGYLDRRKTGNGNYFSQATFGAEALGRDWDFRANAYFPVGDKVKAVGTANTASVAGASVIVSSVTTDERAMKGFDAEVGWRLPIAEAESPRQLRVYAGGYRFKDDVAKVEGPRVRAELTLTEVSLFGSGGRLVLTAEAQRDDLRGSQGFVGVRVRIPLGGRAEQPRLNWQERRMTVPVVRDVDIVAPAVARPAVLETATTLADGRSFTALSSATTTGAALPGAVAGAGAGSVVILSGTFNTTATTTLQAGQTLVGSVAVRTPSGRVATTPSATIDAGFSGFAVTTANNSTVMGLTIRGTGAAGTGTTGVRVVGATGVTIANNVISASELGVNSSNGVFVGAGSAATITGNTISAVANNNAAVATAINVFAGATVTISGNVLSGSGSTTPGFNRFLGFQAGAIINAPSSGNTAAAGVCTDLGAVGTVSFTGGTTCP